MCHPCVRAKTRGSYAGSAVRTKFGLVRTADPAFSPSIAELVPELFAVPVAFWMRLYFDVAVD